MKKMRMLPWVVLLVIGLGLPGCRDHTPTPVKDLIAKKWSAQQVAENGVVFYTKGSTANVRPGYGLFLLDLSSPTAVTYREFDGNTFTGQWTVSPDETKLILTNLTPPPTDSGGTLEFAINEATDTRLVLTRISASPKTGASTNKYTLANP